MSPCDSRQDSGTAAPAGAAAILPARVRVTFVSADGRQSPVDADCGQSLMAIAVTRGVPGIEGECGGAMACGTCHVYVALPSVHPPAGPMEREILDLAAAECRPTSRLACQILLTPDLDGLVVETPSEQG